MHSGAEMLRFFFRDAAVCGTIQERKDSKTEQDQKERRAGNAASGTGPPADGNHTEPEVFPVHDSRAAFRRGRVPERVRGQPDRQPPAQRGFLRDHQPRRADRPDDRHGVQHDGPGRRAPVRGIPGEKREGEGGPVLHVLHAGGPGAGAPAARGIHGLPRQPGAAVRMPRGAAGGL